MIVGICLYVTIDVVVLDNLITKTSYRADYTETRRKTMVWSADHNNLFTNIKSTTCDNSASTRGRQNYEVMYQFDIIHGCNRAFSGICNFIWIMLQLFPRLVQEVYSFAGNSIERLTPRWMATRRISLSHLCQSNSDCFFHGKLMNCSISINS